MVLNSQTTSGFGNVHIFKPQNADKQLWRYVSFLKFVDLLQRRALWFTRLDQFDDPYEGFLPEIISRPSTGKPSGKLDFGYEKWRKTACANCWYMSDYESAAMWDLYSKDGGIAICSRISLIKDSFASDVKVGSWGLYGNAVQYVDFANSNLQTFDAQGSVIPAKDLLCKRKSFEHEQEYRLLICLEEEEQARDIPGKFIPVDLGQLIQKVFVSPTAPGWIVDVIKTEARTYGLAAPVIQSDLYAPILK